MYTVLHGAFVPFHELSIRLHLIIRLVNELLAKGVASNISLSNVQLCMLYNRKRSEQAKPKALCFLALLSFTIKK